MVPRQDLSSKTPMRPGRAQLKLWTFLTGVAACEPLLAEPASSVWACMGVSAQALDPKNNFLI